MTDRPAKGIAENDQVHDRHHKGHDDDKRVTQEFLEIPFEDRDCPRIMTIAPACRFLLSWFPPSSSFFPVRWMKTSSSDGDRIEMEVMGVENFSNDCHNFRQQFSPVFCRDNEFLIFYFN